MLKKFIILFLIFFSFIFNSLKIFSEDQGMKNNIDDIYEETGIDDIISRYSDREIEEKIKNIFDEDIETGFSAKKNKLLSFSPMKIVEYIFSIVRDEIKNIISLLYKMVSIILVLALLEALKVCFNNEGLNEVINFLCVISIFIFVGKPLIGCVKEGMEMVNNISNFIMSFIPVYTGIMSSCGMGAVGGVYNAFLFFLCQVFSEILSNKLLPVLGVYMAFCLVGALSPSLNISKAAKEIKNIVTFCLCFIVAIFVGFITVQGVVASSIDTVGTKAAKFMIGSSVPIIGSIISDAYTSIKGCFNFVRTGAGSMMIVVVVASFLPIIIKLIFWIISTKLSAGLAGFIGVDKVSEFLKASGYVISLLFAIMVSYILLTVVSTTIILVLGMGLT